MLEWFRCFICRPKVKCNLCYITCTYLWEVIFHTHESYVLQSSLVKKVGWICTWVSPAQATGPTLSNRTNTKEWEISMIENSTLRKKFIWKLTDLEHGRYFTSLFWHFEIIQARKGQNSQVDFLANRRLVNAFFTAFYPAEAVEKRALLLLFFFLRAVWFCQQ